MRRLVIIAALLMSIGTAATALAAGPGTGAGTVSAQFHASGYSGKVSLVEASASSARLVVALLGMRPAELATIWALAGSCVHDRFGVVRVRLISPFRYGQWTGSYPLTAQMVGWWNAALATGAVHFRLTQGTTTLCVNGMSAMVGGG
jgi:hypothetical protein